MEKGCRRLCVLLSKVSHKDAARSSSEAGEAGDFPPTQGRRLRYATQFSQRSKNEKMPRLQQHNKRNLGNPQYSLECLYMGNGGFKAQQNLPSLCFFARARPFSTPPRPLFLKNAPNREEVLATQVWLFSIDFPPQNPGIGSSFLSQSR